ncbi:hypothetical protein [Kineobactrum salinum]|uniref:Uncharacterized protein n=1 Tax=Kineobactrum salinum TaxID=2708301 RepID=A0A6C0U4C9_9GAMM|nr:hypothetical protein [Kineobactrum salinum]QIB64304.1 hypothetical protein G3T16_01680 [Kineobactrum salinum]
MRTKQPVIWREHVLSDESVLIRHSDLKRHAACVNPVLVGMAPPEVKAMGS